MEKIFTEGWELRLETQLLCKNLVKKKAYVCSPLRAERKNELWSNIYDARAYMFYAQEAMKIAAIAPHAYLPMLLNDNVPIERDLALRFGLLLMELCDRILVCGDFISSGMKSEIIQATSLRLPIYAFDEKVYKETVDLVEKYGAKNSQIVLIKNHVSLASRGIVKLTRVIKED